MTQVTAAAQLHLLAIELQRPDRAALERKPPHPATDTGSR